MQSNWRLSLGLAMSMLVWLPCAGTPRTEPAATAPGVDAYTPDQLRQRSAALKRSAAGSGAASETLAQYPGHFTMLAYRNRSGTAELHDRFADVLMIVDGSATLLTGGTMVAPKHSGPGETRGTALKQSVATQLNRGDVVHIPAGVPHLLRLEPGASLLYFVVKVQESPVP